MSCGACLIIYDSVYVQNMTCSHDCIVLVCIYIYIWSGVILIGKVDLCDHKNN